jgi:hypothetical protein
MQLSKDATKLYGLIPADGRSAAGNIALREQLGWANERYLHVRKELLDAGYVRLGSGKGGSVKRVQDLEQALLAEVPTDGKTIGNIALIRKLGWAEDAYWPVRDALIDRGELVRGGGRGGSVYRVIADVEEDDLDLGAVAPARRAGLAVEKDLYEPIRKVLKKSWAKDQRFLTNSIVKTIANVRQGAGGTGKWSQPDLLFLGLPKYELMGQSELNVVTFEVKRLGGWDIKSIYQAEAHKQNANYSYVFLHNEDDSSERENDANFQRCRRKAFEFKVGLIVASDPGNYETWNTVVEAQRNNLALETVETFVAEHVNEDERDQILRWWC